MSNEASRTRRIPVILRADGLGFFFYANEGNPREPAHVHVRSAGIEAKFWLVPDVQLVRNDGFDASSLRRIEKQVRQHRETFLRAWNEYFA
ncbi:MULTISPECIES: DUF4160 domain-containing protein [unclassified Thiocapsa]